MSMKAVISEKGQVTIPKTLRDRLGLHAGHTLDFREHRGRLVATKSLAEDPVGSVYGILKLGRNTDVVIRDLRGPVETK